MSRFFLKKCLDIIVEEAGIFKKRFHENKNEQLSSCIKTTKQTWPKNPVKSTNSAQD
jgi:hypothetical protein